MSTSPNGSHPALNMALAAFSGNKSVFAAAKGVHKAAQKFQSGGKKRLEERYFQGAFPNIFFFCFFFRFGATSFVDWLFVSCCVVDDGEFVGDLYFFFLHVALTPSFVNLQYVID